MFVLGLALGLLLAVVGFIALSLLVGREASRPYQARAAIRNIERQTIHAMLVAEQAAQRSGAADVIEGSAS